MKCRKWSQIHMVERAAYIHILHTTRYNINIFAKSSFGRLHNTFGNLTSATRSHKMQCARDFKLAQIMHLRKSHMHSAHSEHSHFQIEHSIARFFVGVVVVVVIIRRCDKMVPYHWAHSNPAGIKMRFFCSIASVCCQ